MKIKIFMIRKVDTYFRHEKTLKMKTNKTTDDFKYGNKRYTINKYHPTYIHKNELIYMFDIEKGSALVFNEIVTILHPEMYEKIVGRNMIYQALKGITKSSNMSGQILGLVFGIIIGGLLGFIICQFIYSAKIEEILSNPDSIIIVN